MNDAAFFKQQALRAKLAEQEEAEAEQRREELQRQAEQQRLQRQAQADAEDEQRAERILQRIDRKERERAAQAASEQSARDRANRHCSIEALTNIGFSHGEAVEAVDGPFQLIGLPRGEHQ